MEQSGFEGIFARYRGAGAAGNRRAGAVAILFAAFLAITVTGYSKPVHAGLLDDDPVVPGEFQQPLHAIPYADAMADCAGRILTTLVMGCELIPAELEERHSFWIWRSEAGATVNRTRGGDYRIRAPSCLGGFCSWRSCRVSDWPVLTCSDGGKLKAHVPDQSRFVLGDTDYVRVREMR